MKNIKSTLLGLAITALSACGGADGAANLAAGTATDAPQVGSSEARLIVAVQGSGSATLKVTAVNDANADVAIDQTVSVKGGSAALLDVSVAPSSYTFTVDAFADAAETILLGSGSAQASLAAGATTDVKLTTALGASGNGSAGESGSADVQVSVVTAPKIEGIDVHVDGSGALGAGAALGKTVVLHVDAVDSTGGALSFFWSGFGIDGAVEGSATMTIDVNAALEASVHKVVHVVAQNATGATTTASVDLTTALAAAGSVGGSLGAGGSSSASASAGASASASASAGSGAGVGVSTGSGAGASASVAACLNADVQCNATCDAALSENQLAVAAHVACVAQCSLALAACDAN